MLVALFFIGVGAASLIGQKRRTGSHHRLGLMLIAIGVVMLALVVEYPHR